MPQLTLTFGLVFVALGLVGYFATGMQSVTALIPAFLGVIFVALGLIMRDEKKVKHAGHAAATLALVGLIGSARGVPNAVTMIQGGEVARPAASIVQTIMVVLCVAFVALAIKSFVDARKARATSAT